MNTHMTKQVKQLLMTVAIVSAPVAAMADGYGDAPFQQVQQALWGDGPSYPTEAAAVHGPAGPIMETKIDGEDPHVRVQRAFWGEGPSYDSTADAHAVRGPAGPVMGDEHAHRIDAFERYDKAFIGD